MHSLKKRVAIVFLAVAMAATMFAVLPANAFADEPAGSSVAPMGVPTVVSVTPPGLASASYLSGSLIITFSEEMNPTPGIVTLIPTSGGSGGSLTPTFSGWQTATPIPNSQAVYPISGLDPNTTYTVDISGFNSLTDPMAPDDTNSFTTMGLVSVAGQPINVTGGTMTGADYYFPEVSITVPYSQATITDSDIVIISTGGSWQLVDASGTAVVEGGVPGGVANLNVGSDSFDFSMYYGDGYFNYTLTIIREPEVPQPPVTPPPSETPPPSVPSTGDNSGMLALAALLMAAAGTTVFGVSRRIRRSQG